MYNNPHLYQKFPCPWAASSRRVAVFLLGAMALCSLHLRSSVAHDGDLNEFNLKDEFERSPRAMQQVPGQER